MDCYPVYPGFETLSIFILVDVREDFQERILHGFFRFTTVADNAQASYVQSLCELFVQAQLRTPFSRQPFISCTVVSFICLYKREKTSDRCISVTKLDKKKKGIITMPLSLN